jgi:DNA-binding transcriptional LysR family regulator
MRSMDLRQVEVFYYVARFLSFSKAAEALLLTQPTISGHIKSLEESLAMTLFDRLGREVRLTRAGEVLYGHAKRLLATKTAALQALQELQGAMHGELVIGGSSIPGQYILPKVLGRFQPRYPGITVVLSITDTMQTLDRVVRGEIELGVVGATVPHPQVVYHPFVEDELVLAVASDHPWSAQPTIPLQALLEQPFIQRERGSGSRLVVEQTLKAHGLDPTKLRVIAEMDTTEAIKQGIKAGVGLSIISHFALADEVRAGTICTIAIRGVTIRRHFSLVRHKARTLSPLAQTFERFLHEMIPISLPSLDTANHDPC